MTRDDRPDGSFKPIGWRSVTVSGVQPLAELDLGELTPPYASLSSAAGEARTEVIMVPPAVPDLSWMPPAEPRPAPELKRPRRRGPGLLQSLVSAAALGVIIVGSFVAGQWTNENGVRPVLPMPPPAGSLETVATTARIWHLGTPGEHAQHCRWLAATGETREYTLNQWTSYVASSAGGRVDDPDRAVVARVLDDACAGRRP